MAAGAFIAQRDAERVVVAAAAAQVGPLDERPGAEVAEDVVEVVAVDVLEALRQAPDGRRPGVRVEVAHQEHRVPGPGVLRDDREEVVRHRGGPARAAGVQGQGAVVVHEEHGPPGLQVLDAHPLRVALPRAARGDVLHVLGEVDLPVREQGPARLEVGEAERVSPLEHAVRVREAHVLHQEPRVLALLEGHEVGHAGLLDDTLRAPAALPVEDLPPLEVVAEQLQLAGAPAPAAGPAAAVRRDVGPARVAQHHVSSDLAGHHVRLPGAPRVVAALQPALPPHAARVVRAAHPGPRLAEGHIRAPRAAERRALDAVDGDAALVLEVHAGLGSATLPGGLLQLEAPVAQSVEPVASETKDYGRHGEHQSGRRRKCESAPPAVPRLPPVRAAFAAGAG
eukprot:CAMPEP_0179300576 /NCGR_PEP_ID=MMETSP0797-20121207/47106_1 /TAXON_ID=47934 /ORGANISM="Dinophysis acuminata, Strain DAEP01" /LENGTH=395 /DNA_ID=CAMNT_0021010051 /DNA_START=291 /DNA_END=1476 /DNA_ORIENTATION=-